MYDGIGQNLIKLSQTYNYIILPCSYQGIRDFLSNDIVYFRTFHFFLQCTSSISMLVAKHGIYMLVNVYLLLWLYLCILSFTCM